jgi:hypothetical protein
MTQSELKLTQQMKGWGATPALSGNHPKMAFFMQKGVRLP